MPRPCPVFPGTDDAGEFSALDGVHEHEHDAHPDGLSVGGSLAETLALTATSASGGGSSLQSGKKRGKKEKKEKKIGKKIGKASTAAPEEEEETVDGDDGNILGGAMVPAVRPPREARARDGELSSRHALRHALRRAAHQVAPRFCWFSLLSYHAYTACTRALHPSV